MTPHPTSSLVVATYNWPAALAAVLATVRRQTVLPTEVIVADDGSGEPTRKVVEAAAADFPCPLVHVWHPDEGFKLAQIRNKAVARARGAYVIQIDGDMLLHRAFVEDHLDAAEPGFFVGGSRALLDAAASQAVLAGAPLPGARSAGVRNRFNALRWAAVGRALAPLVPARDPMRVRGGNMGFWREDFVAVNGYDEAFVGWGREDTDLVVRLHRRGLRRRWFKLRGVTFHLHHKEASRAALDRNDDILQRALASGRDRCALGIDQYLPALGYKTGP
jgi:glycosyltransferase involved in cell wall biosynthesis